MGEETPSRLRVMLRYARSLMVLPFLLTGLVFYAIFAPHNAREDVPPFTLSMLGAAALLAVAGGISGCVWLVSRALT